MQKLTLRHPPNAVIAESLPKRTLAELGKLLMFTVRWRATLRAEGRSVIFGILTTTILLALAPQSGSGSDTICSQPS
jgi:hypothetical protein